MKYKQVTGIGISIFLLLSSTLLIQPIQSKPIMNTINEIEEKRNMYPELIQQIQQENTVKSDNKNIIQKIIQNDPSTSGLLSWLIQLIQKLIELLKKPFEILKEFFEKLSNLFDAITLLLTNIIKLIDWIVKQAIIGVIISIILTIIEFIRYIIRLIEENDEDNTEYYGIFNIL